MYYLRLAFRNLFRHRGRTVITALVLALAVFVFIFMDSIMAGMEEMSFRNIIDLQSAHLEIGEEDFYEDGVESPGRDVFVSGEELTTAVREIEGFQALTSMVSFGATFSRGREEFPVLVRGIAPDSYREVFKLQNYIEKGSFFTEDTGAEGIIIGRQLADLFELEVGDYPFLLFRDAGGSFNTFEGEIIGIVNSPNPEVNSRTVFIGLERAREVLGIGEEQITQLVVRLDGREQALPAAGFLRGKIDESGLKVRTWRDSAELIIAMSEVEEIENTVILILILMIGALGVINTIILSAMERVQEIGMMKAMGLTEKEIIRIFTLEAGGIGIIGGVLGCLAGAIGVGLFSHYGYDISTFFEGGMETYGIPIIGRIYGAWNLQAFVFVFVFGIIISLLAGYFPARWAAHKDPVDALHHH